MKLSLFSCAAPITFINEDDDKQKLSITVLQMQSDDTGVNFVCNRVEESITVAELMMDYPGHFVSCPAPMPYHAQTNPTVPDFGKLCPLTADVEVQRGRLYLLLPMRKLNGRFTQEENDALACHVMPKTIMKAVPATSSPGAYLRKFRSVTSLVQILIRPSTKVSPLLISAGTRASATKTSPVAAIGYKTLGYVSEDSETTPRLSLSRPWTPKLDTIAEVKSF